MHFCREPDRKKQAKHNRKPLKRLGNEGGSSNPSDFFFLHKGMEQAKLLDLTHEQMMQLAWFRDRPVSREQLYRAMLEFGLTRDSTVADWEAMYVREAVNAVKAYGKSMTESVRHCVLGFGSRISSYFA